MKQQRARRNRNIRAFARLELQDAFEFLAELAPSSVDLIVSSPPYCMGKEYDSSISIKDFVADHERPAPLLVRALRSGGSLCWQVGNHVHNGVVVPLDAIVYPIFTAIDQLLLRNRIVWTFGHGRISSTSHPGFGPGKGNSRRPLHGFGNVGGRDCA